MLGFGSTIIAEGAGVRASLGESFYNVSVTPGEMWRDVGKVLRDARLDKHLTPLDVERAGGPTYKTVQAIEDGRAGNVRNLEKCAAAPQLSIVDVLYAVLNSRERPLSPEAAQIVRTYAETTVAGRTALVALSNALPPMRQRLQRQVDRGLPRGQQRVVLGREPPMFVDARGGCRRRRHSRCLLERSTRRYAEEQSPSIGNCMQTTRTDIRSRYTCQNTQGMDTWR
jgi:hypothetical protein